MCVHPVYMSCPRGVPASIVRKSGIPKDEESSFVVVPCGKCEECRSAFLNKYLDACIFYSKNFYPFFLSCSIKPSMMSQFLFVEYFESSYINRFFRNLVNAGLVSKIYHYIGVKERGSKRGRPHCHFILFLDKDFVKSFSNKLYRSDEFYMQNFSRKVKEFWRCWSVNIGTRKFPVYEQICDYVVKGNKRSFSLDPIVGNSKKSLSYVLKYQFVQDQPFAECLLDCWTNLGRKAFNIVRNKILLSRGFHNWLYDYVSEFILWDRHPFYGINYPFLKTKDCYKPLSLRSVKNITKFNISDSVRNSFIDVYNFCLKFVQSQDYDVSLHLHRLEQDKSRRYKRLFLEKNRINFADPFAD